MVDSLALRMARTHVKSFQDESGSLMREHREAMECMDCESFLQLGIDAFNWLIRADETVRKSIYLKLAEHDPDIDDAIENLFREWLKPVEIANQWITSQQHRGYTLDKLAEFRECERQVRGIVNSLDSRELSDAMSELRNEAVTEHLNGETAEFV